MPNSFVAEYQSKVVGMLWSMLAQEQTWFGNEPWKSYGIQVYKLPMLLAFIKVHLSLVLHSYCRLQLPLERETTFRG